MVAPKDKICVLPVSQSYSNDTLLLRVKLHEGGLDLLDVGLTGGIDLLLLLQRSIWERDSTIDESKASRALLAEFYTKES
jgi:hypothetical protein